MQSASRYLLPVFIIGLICQSCGLSNRHLSNRAFLRRLSGLEYRIGDLAVRLENGKYVQETAPDAASEIHVVLSEWLVLGDLNGDHQSDAAVILIANQGNAAKHYYLVPVIRQGKQLAALDAISIGDRISMVSLSIADRQIDVVYLDKEPGNQTESSPKTEIRRRFSVRSDALTELSLFQNLYVKR